MYCANCGTQVQDNQKFCSRCGQPILGPAAAPNVYTPPPASPTPGPGTYTASPAVGAYPAPQLRSRLATHLRILGVLWIVVSALRLLPALGLLAFGHLGHFRYPFWSGHMPFFMGPFLGGLGVFMSATAVIGLAAGWGLLDRRPWARMLAIVIGCLSLLSFPFGTALGIYTLWVLASAGADVEYERLARLV